MARGVLLEALKLLHPVMPFITEEIAHHLGAEGLLITTPYPARGRWRENPEVLALMAAFQAVVQETRSYRHLVGLSPGTPLALSLLGLEPAWRDAFSRMAAELCRLAGLSALELNPGTVPVEAIRDLAGGVNVAILLPSGALGDAESVRLAAELAKLEAEAHRVNARLADASFTARAPEDVVAASRQRAAELAHKTQLLAATLERKP